MWGWPTPSTFYWYLVSDTAVIDVENAANMSFTLHIWETQGTFSGRLEHVDDVHVSDPVQDVLIGRVWCNR